MYENSAISCVSNECRFRVPSARVNINKIEWSREAPKNKDDGSFSFVICLLALKQLTKDTDTNPRPPYPKDIIQLQPDT